MKHVVLVTILHFLWSKRCGSTSFLSQNFQTFSCSRLHLIIIFEMDKPVPKDKSLAAITIQSCFRMHRARIQASGLHELKEEEVWRLSLAKRRERIQRLERELRYLEDLPAEDVVR